MKLAVLGTLLFAVAAVIASADEKSNQVKSQAMTLRLELFVSDLPKSIDFYTNVLGFERLGGEADYVPVRSGAVVIGLGPVAGLPKQHPFNPDIQKSRRGLGTEIVLEVEDVDAFYKAVKATGFKGTLSQLRRQPWGLTDFRIVDPDKYYLRITSR